MRHGDQASIDSGAIGKIVLRSPYSIDVANTVVHVSTDIIHLFAADFFNFICAFSRYQTNFCGL